MIIVTGLLQEVELILGLIEALHRFSLLRLRAAIASCSIAANPDDSDCLANSSSLFWSLLLLPGTDVVNTDDEFELFVLTATLEWLTISRETVKNRKKKEKTWNFILYKWKQKLRCVKFIKRKRQC